MVEPLLGDSARRGTRIRLILRQTDGEQRPARIVEGIVVSMLEGRDGRMRVRMGIPTGSGDPVEVRVLLESIERVEPVDAGEIAPAMPGRPSTGSHRRKTLAFGSDPSLRRSDASASTKDSWNDLPTQTPDPARTSK